MIRFKLPDLWQNPRQVKFLNKRLGLQRSGSTYAQTRAGAVTKECVHSDRPDGYELLRVCQEGLLLDSEKCLPIRNRGNPRGSLAKLMSVFIGFLV